MKQQDADMKKQDAYMKKQDAYMKEQVACRGTKKRIYEGTRENLKEQDNLFEKITNLVMKRKPDFRPW